MSEKILFKGDPYNPGNTEKKIYEAWEQSGFFNPDNLPGKSSENYIVYMPLPNITGSLHIGHALNNTIQDILIRYHRMRGYRTLWLPGTDHASISTQYVVDKSLRKKGISRFDLGREKFIEKVWEWKKEYGGIITQQLRRLGCSADWSRERFTMDENYTKDVMRAFVHYHKKDLLYRGLRTINWCPRCGTSLSELELAYEDKKTNLWYFKYPIKDMDESIIVATTRPETMLGDTAVSVHPNDERWKKFIGKKVLLPIQNREIPIISDESIDPSFGTGAVKITPAHDTTDFELSTRHNIPLIQVIDERGRMTKEAGKEFEGIKTLEAREKIIHMMNELGFLEKTEDYNHRTLICGRCNSVIEPIPSLQWFIKMKELAMQALTALENKKIKINPKNFEKIYTSWLSNIRDWNVSRQLWWGHQLPVWFCKEKEDTYIISEAKPEKCPFCKKCEMEQSTDVLDTWFSSALWPFAGLSENDQKKYYPGNILVTARDIINLWVARMVYSGIEFMNTLPFQDIIINGTILTKDGKRMSKSLGTGVDPLKYIEDFGADALRFAVIWQATGQDIHWDESAVAAGKKFMNKLWNASRFVLTKINKKGEINTNKNTESDNKILTALEEIKKKNKEHINQYEFSEALKELYDFFWHDYCDIYLEEAKKQLTDNSIKNNTEIILYHVLSESINLLHPFIPFITEEIYQHFEEKETKYLMIRNILK